MTIRPLHDRILVKRDEEPTQYGTIVIPEAAKEKPQQGVVLAVGQGVKREDGSRVPLDVRLGDRVLFGRYAGSEVEIGAEKYLMLREEDLLGVIE